MAVTTTIIPLFAGWVLDMMFGDPAWLPHPVVGFGKSISYCERRFNRGGRRMLKGGFSAVGLIVAVFMLSYFVLDYIGRWEWLRMSVETVAVFFCLAGKTLVKEVRLVFEAVAVSVDSGRRQVARIVGRDTGSLSGNEIRTAALETLAENLSDGVVAPLFWFALLGVPGMLAYKMVNTLDSMIGYRTERYREFGCVAAGIDDFANYLPARLTAMLMVLASGRPGLLKFVRRYGRAHASPNSGYPEAALAGILDCRFGGTHDYFGEKVEKPYIGVTRRELTDHDLVVSVQVFRVAEAFAVAFSAATRALIVLVSVGRL